jgi:hypothetical protein
MHCFMSVRGDAEADTAKNGPKCLPKLTILADCLIHMLLLVIVLYWYEHITVPFCKILAAKS